MRQQQAPQGIVPPFTIYPRPWKPIISTPNYWTRNPGLGSWV